VWLFRGRSTDAAAGSTAILDALGRASGALPADFTSCLRVRSAAALQLADAGAAERAALEALKIAEARLGPHHDQTVLSLISVCSAQARKASPQALDTCEDARRRALRAYAPALEDYARPAHLLRVTVLVRFSEQVNLSVVAVRSLPHFVPPMWWA
jgi:hypothetical protein